MHELVFLFVSILPSKIIQISASSEKYSQTLLVSSPPSHFSGCWPLSWSSQTPGAPSSPASSSTSSESSRGGQAASSSAPTWPSGDILASYWSILLNSLFSLVSWLLGLSLDLALSPLLPLAWAPVLTPGPLSLVLPLFVPYFSSVPPVSR